MVYEFKFPDVGEGITEGKLVKWNVKVGDAVAVDQSVAEVETDKSIVEIPSPHPGTVTELKYQESDMLEVGQVMMVLDDGGAPAAPTPEEKKEEPAPEPQPSTPPVQEAPSTSEPVAPAPQPAVAPVEQPQPESIPSLSSSDGILAMPAVRHAAKEKGIDLNTVKGTGAHGQITMQDLEGGQPTQTVPTSEPQPSIPPVQEAPSTSEPVAPAPQSAQVAVAGEDIIATPAVRKKARELGIDINTIKGSGDQGRILESDLTTPQSTPASVSAAPQPTVVSTPEPASPTEEPPTADPEPQGTSQTLPLTGIRGVIAQRMTESLQKTAQVTHTDEADITRLVELRKEQKPVLEKMGVKLTYLPFFIKAFIATAKDFPAFNALINEQANQIVFQSEYHIGIAVDSPKGLMVPVIQNSQDKSIIDLAREIVNVATLAKDAKLTPEQMTGSTFTISSVGSLGGQVFTPIINYPNTAILGIGKIVKKPIVKEDKVVIADTVTFSLTFDHRVMDGADAARFLSLYIQLLEKPDLLFLEMD